MCLIIGHIHHPNGVCFEYRYDVQLLLENSTILWPSYKESEASGSVVEDEEEIALQEALDIERYQVHSNRIFSWIFSSLFV